MAMAYTDRFGPAGGGERKEKSAAPQAKRGRAGKLWECTGKM